MYYLFSLILFIFFIPTIVYSSETLRTEAIPEAPVLDEIIVSASAETNTLKNIPLNIQSIDQEEIDNIGATNLGQLLERTTAGSIVIQPGNFSQINLCGFRSGRNIQTTLSDQVLILIDGNRSGTGNINNIPIENIERIEIIRGPTSALYGGSAVGGIINLITKKGKGKPSVHFTSNYGTANFRNIRIGSSGGVKDDRWGYAIAGALNACGDYRTGEGNRYPNTHFHNGSGSGSINFQPNEHSNFSGFLTYKKTYDTGSPGENTLEGRTPKDGIKDDYLFISLQHNTQCTDTITLTTSIYTNKNSYEYINRKWESESGYESYLSGGKTIITMPIFTISHVSLGAEYIHLHENVGGSAIYNPNARTDVLSTFLEHHFDIIKDLFWQYGIRYDYYRERLKSVGPITVNSSVTNFQHFSWNTGAIWWFINGLGIRTSLGTAFVPPTSAQLAGKYQIYHNGPQYIGNSRLKSEQSLTSTVGVDISLNKLNGTIDYFYTKYINRITTKKVDKNYHYINQGQHYISGIEASLTYTHDLNISLPHPCIFAPYINVEYLTKRNNNKNQSSKIICNQPKYTATGGIGLGYKLIWIDINTRLTGPMCYSDYNYNTQSITIKNAHSFAIYNSRITITPTMGLSFFLDLQNITNKYYAYTPGYPMPGLSLKLGVTYEY